MALADDFAAAQTAVKQLTKSPSTDELLDLYSLYKQATVGDVQGKRPEVLDFKGRAKFDAWTKRKGMGKDDAMTAYVALVAKLTGKHR
jgi:acyl-CoA-binding protein